MNDYLRAFYLSEGPYLRRRAIETYLEWRRFSFGGFISRRARKEALRLSAKIREART